MKNYPKDEEKIIGLINRMIPSGPARLNNSYESDSEILKNSNTDILLFNMDEFSSEDLLREHDPATLGWNAAIGGISDIYAAGGRPLFYAHAMIIDKTWDEAYIRKFSSGVADVLKTTGTTFIGGDFGMADHWRYTISVIGKPFGTPVSRMGASAGDLIFISGEIGAGNLEALLNLYAGAPGLAGAASHCVNRFSIPYKEASLISRYATSCTDTSDGLFNSINTLSKSNHTGYELENLPYIEDGVRMMTAVDLPKILLFLGECGEYQLLFTVKASDKENLLKEAKRKHLSFHQLGRMISDPSRSVVQDGERVDLTGLTARARDFDTVQAYLASLFEWLKKNGQ